MSQRLPLLALLAASASAPLLASDGRIPIYQPTFITQPGAYYLTRDVASSSGSVITIYASGVTLDLAGHTIDATGANSAIYAYGAGNLRVSNGRIVGGFTGVDLQSPTSGEYRFEGLHLKGQSIGIALYQNGTAAPRVVIRNNVLEQSSLNLYKAHGGVVEENRIVGTVFGAIYVQSCHGLTVRANTVTDGPTGIQLVDVKGCLVADNVVGSTAATGIALVESQHCTVSRNSASGNQGIGIFFNEVAFSTLDGNVASGNGASGIFIDGASSGNVYSNNRTLANASGNVFSGGSVSAGGNNAGGANF